MYVESNNLSAIRPRRSLPRPRSFPFLLVDRVIDYEQGKYAVAIKNVTINDNFFPGHFPQRPIMPGVLMVEAMAQVGGIVMLDPKDEAARNQFFFGGIDQCRFRKPVVPGDTLVMRVECTKVQDGTLLGEFTLLWQASLQEARSQ